MGLSPVNRLAVTTVVDNSVDILRSDEKVARRWSVSAQPHPAHGPG